MGIGFLLGRLSAALQGALAGLVNGQPASERPQAPDRTPPVAARGADFVSELVARVEALEGGWDSLDQVVEELEKQRQYVDDQLERMELKRKTLAATRSNLDRRARARGEETAEEPPPPQGPSTLEEARALAKARGISR